jgi:hypothetical protein
LFAWCSSEVSERRARASTNGLGDVTAQLDS